MEIFMEIQEFDDLKPVRTLFYRCPSRSLLAKVSQVTLPDLIRVGRTYVTPLFDPTQSSVAICCHPSKVEEIKEEFKRYDSYSPSILV